MHGNNFHQDYAITHFKNRPINIEKFFFAHFFCEMQVFAVKFLEMTDLL